MLRTMRVAPFPAVILAILLSGAAAPCQAGGAAAPNSPGELAARILGESGVRGGLVVHLGCGKGTLTAALAVGGRYTVHGLDGDPDDVADARAHIHSLGLYGKVSVDRFQGGRLPYADNLVNLAVVDAIDGVAVEEVERVLAPRGVAMLREGDRWRKIVKPRPGEIGEWTHFLHDAGGNAVADDHVVGPPERMQWEAGPRWCRSHEFPSSVNAAVTAGGRLFCILDEGPIGVYEKLPQKCSLVARDAANGLLLWRQPMRLWGYEYGTGLGTRWNIHHTLPRRLVAGGDRVYVTLSFQGSPVSVLDAATGEILVEAIPGTEGADEMLLDGGILVVKITDESPGATGSITRSDLGGSLAAVDAESGKLLWRKEGAAVAPYALALREGRLVYHDLAELVCLEAASGRPLWRVDLDAERIPGAGTTLVLAGNVVLHHSYRREPRPGSKKGIPVAKLTALAAEDGRERWTAKGEIGLAGACTQPTDLFVAGGLVWCGGAREGRDLVTGEVKHTLELGQLISPGHHYRCYRSKATEEFLIWPKRGAEFVDLDGNRHMRHDWLRAPCFTGMLPANGLLYVPPSQCFCYPGVKLAGFLALAAAEQSQTAGWTSETLRDSDRLERGPAYGEVFPPSSFPLPPSSDWPMYRRDALRSGATQAGLPPELAKLWEVQLACRASQPIVAGGRLFVAEKDAHRIRCLGAADGRPLWDFTTGGRIDSPPSVCGPLVLFGCRDGSVYCLRADDGQLVWRFRAAPQERLVMSYEQLESAWPVHGSVLIRDGVVYFAAGRSSFLDGGILVYGLGLQSGEVLHRAHLEGPRPDVAEDIGGPFAMEGARADLLVGDGEHLYMERIKFDGHLNRLPTPQLTTLGDLDMGGRHLLATGGFLDDSGFDRLFWMHTARWPGFYFAQQAPKSGQLVVFDDQMTYAVKYFYRRHGLSPSFVPAEEGYLLFADALDNDPVLVDKDGRPQTVEWLPASARTSGRYDISARSVDVEKGVGYTRAEPAKWQKLVPVRARAMVLAGDRLVVAGPPDVIEPGDPHAALEGRSGAVLQVFSSADGALLFSPRPCDGGEGIWKLAR